MNPLDVFRRYKPEASEVREVATGYSGDRISQESNGVYEELDPDYDQGHLEGSLVYIRAPFGKGRGPEYVEAVGVEAVLAFDRGLPSPIIPNRPEVLMR